MIEKILVLFLLASPVLVLFTTFLAIFSRTEWIRSSAVLSTLVCAFSAGFITASGRLLNNVIDMCDDQTSWYFEKHGAFHPNCDVWKRSGDR